MRYGWIAGLALLAGSAGLGTSPASAQDPVISPELAAYLEIGGGAYFGLGDSFFPGDPRGLFAAAGRASIPVRGSWNLQVDVQTLTHFGSTVPTGTTAATYAHLYHRGGANAFGGFAGIAFGITSPTGVAGIEAVHFGPRAIITAQGLYAFQENFGEVAHIWQGRLAISYFLSDNTAIFAEALGTRYSDDFGVLSGILGIRHRLTSLPVSAFAQFRVDDVVNGGFLDGIRVGSVLAGFSVYFNGPNTLRGAEEAVPMRVRWAPLSLTSLAIL